MGDLIRMLTALSWGHRDSLATDYWNRCLMKKKRAYPLCCFFLSVLRLNSFIIWAISIEGAIQLIALRFRFSMFLSQDQNYPFCISLNFWKEVKSEMSTTVYPLAIHTYVYTYIHRNINSHKYTSLSYSNPKMFQITQYNYPICNSKPYPGGNI